jgi:hypothetical protein
MGFEMVLGGFAMVLEGSKGSIGSEGSEVSEVWVGLGDCLRN